MPNIKVVCPNAGQCEWISCMHHKPHKPVGFGHGGTCLNTRTSCLDYTGTCQPVKKEAKLLDNPQPRHYNIEASIY